MLRKFKQISNISSIFSSILCEKGRIVFGQFLPRNKQVMCWLLARNKFKFWLYEVVQLQDDSVQYNFVFSNTLISYVCISIELKMISILGFAT